MPGVLSAAGLVLRWPRELRCGLHLRATGQSWLMLPWLAGGAGDWRGQQLRGTQSTHC